MSASIYCLDSVAAYNEMVGLPTFHPLVSVVDLNQATRQPNINRWNYGLYALFLKMDKACTIQYGRQTYDYDAGAVVTFAPGQMVTITPTSSQPQSNVYGLLFHPDLLRGTSLAKSIRRYDFFAYSAVEALHLSDQERSIVIDSLHAIRAELQRGADAYTQSILVSQIETLLNYCLRFYDRQFLTRKPMNSDVLVRFESLLDNYFLTDHAHQQGLPTVKYFASELCLSPNYFGDLLKRVTGKSPKTYIQQKIIAEAKQRLFMTDTTISIIAQQLGFRSHTHFSAIFKDATGMSPSDYRRHAD